MVEPILVALSKRNKLLAGGVIIAMLLGFTYLVYASGGTRTPYPHTMYLPIALAAYRFGFTGSFIAAVAAGFLMGPIMPLNLSTGELQSVQGWLYRMSFYALAGGAFGAGATMLRRRRDEAIHAFRALESTHAATLHAFTSVLESYDDHTGEHCGRVAANARVVGQELDITGSQLNKLYWAGILHDIGKVAIPQRILQKPSTLNENEFDVVRRHPTFGAHLLTGISKSFEDVAAGVESHHERWDGRGYPKGVSGPNIPLFGRILAVVDSFEAMTADRPYRKPLTPAEALGELQKCSGAQYDPNLVRVYERLYWRGQLQIAGEKHAEDFPYPVSPVVYDDYRNLN